MMRTINGFLIACLLMAAGLPVFGQSDGKGNDTIVLGREISPMDTTIHRRFINRLIAPKGEWQCGLSVMYTDFNSANSDYMLLLQGLDAKASMMSIAPEAAYTFMDNHAVGVKFNYSKLSGMLDAATADLLGNLSLSVSDVSATSSSIGGSVFQRTYVGLDRQGRFGIFWDYILGYSRTSTQFTAGDSASPSSVREKVYLAFAPGVVYFPMNNISIQANISIADISYSCTTAFEDGNAVGIRRGWKALAGLNLLNLSFGLTLHL